MIINTILILYILPMILLWVIAPFEYLQSFKKFFTNDIIFKESFKNRWNEYDDWIDFCSLYKYSLIPGFNIIILYFTTIKVIFNAIYWLSNWIFKSILSKAFSSIEKRIINIKFSQIKSFFKGK